MLEKVRGNIEVSKLRAILFLKADFNSLNKIIFNRRVLPYLENKKEIPYKIIYRRRDQSLLHIALNKKLVADCSNQIKYPTVVVSVDASNYYDHIVYPFSSMTSQSLDFN